MYLERLRNETNSSVLHYYNTFASALVAIRFPAQFAPLSFGTPPVLCRTEQTAFNVLCYSMDVRALYGRNTMLQVETQFWHKLSKQAVHDQNPEKLKIIIDEVNRVLEEKAARLQDRRAGPDRP
jgi:hypothetical protein